MTNIEYKIKSSTVTFVCCFRLSLFQPLINIVFSKSWTPTQQNIIFHQVVLHILCN